MSNQPAHAYAEPEGPFRAHQIREGDHYELSNGHAISYMSAGERHGKANILGGVALASDPEVKGNLGADVGIEFNDGKNLRALDLVVGIEGRPGWSQQVPTLCIEYADRDQDEATLREKISELLELGVRHLWVVRLAGPLRVEVHEPGQPMRTVDADGFLEAPGVLANRYTPRELVDQEAALQAAFRNQLQALGYQSLDEVRLAAQKQAADERDEALRAGVYDLCEVLGIEVTDARRQQVDHLDAPGLRALRQRLKAERRWPAE